jgi:hypothetical protein
MHGRQIFRDSMVLHRAALSKLLNLLLFGAFLEFVSLVLELGIPFL